MSDIILPDNFQLKTEYVWVTDNLKVDLDKIAHENMSRLLWNYFKKYVNTDAEVHMHLRIEKNKQEKYECKTTIVYDGNQFYRSNDIPFKEPFDVVNHAFKHLKEHLANS